MRKHSLDITLDSDRDLTALQSNRIQVEKVGESKFKITSVKLRFWGCERHQFVGRLIKRRMPGYAWITGNCSCPDGYFWDKATGYK